MNLHDRVSRRLKLRDLRLVMTVAEWGSMAKAAIHLSLTQSAVSRAIAELEHTLGVRLFDRTAQGVEPTMYGRALLRGGLAVFDDLRISVNEIEHLADPTTGELRIGTTEPTGYGIAPVVIDRLSRLYPRLAFEVVQADFETLIERELRGRTIELALSRTASSGRQEELEETILYSDRLCIVAGASSPWASRRKIKLADLVHERWCLPPPGHPVMALVTEAFRRAGLEPPQRSVTVTASPFVSNLVDMGNFLGVHGTVNLRFNPASRSLKILPVELPIPLAPVSIIALKNRTLSPLARLFIEQAREIARPFARLK